MSNLTSDFYRRVGESFSQTRGNAWPGWERVLDEIAPKQDDRMAALDLACGNLRFERALFARYPNARAVAVDSCDELAGRVDKRVDYRHLDLAELLLSDSGVGDALAHPPVDVAVSFAFMHHLPLFEQRERLLAELVAATRASGLVAVSFWQFADDARLRKKAERATDAACERFDLSGLGAGDYLMGWQDVDGVYRFCHHCTDEEIDALLNGVAGRAHVVARYRADGASGELNQYVLLRVAG